MKVTVLFIKLSALTYEQGKALDVQSIHHVAGFMQKVIFKSEGTVRQFLVDDKGTVLVAAFGLPPFSHRDDPLRGFPSISPWFSINLTLWMNRSTSCTSDTQETQTKNEHGHFHWSYNWYESNNDLAKRLLTNSPKIKPTGQAFCGCIGNDKRQEYELIGDIVNLCARLMGVAHKEKRGTICSYIVRR